MTTEKKSGIWMDLANAHLMKYANPIVTKIVTSVSIHEEKEKPLQKGENMMHNKDQRQQSGYYKTLGKLLKIMMRFYYLIRPMRGLNYLIFLKLIFIFSKIKFETNPGN